MRSLLVVILLAPMLLSAVIHRVNLSGTHGFTSIQSAVNFASPNDTILVYPGTYIENVIINSKNLTLTSLELTTGDSTYVTQTIINGNQTGSCIVILDSNCIIRGLYLTNGIGNIASGFNGRVGGGIYCQFSTLVVINCNIIRNVNVTSGAGIYAESSSLCLAGSTIAFNHGFSGAALIIPWSTISFDPFNRCSIYLNTATVGNDIHLGTAGTYNIYLDKFSVPNSTEYIHEFIHTGSDVHYTLDFNTPVIIPQFADFYVSPDGNDDNSGLSPDQPLRTIAWALLKIQADSLHPQNIYLADGVYSYSLNKQRFPLNLRSYVTIQGQSQAETVLDMENTFTAMHGWNSEKKVAVKNITIINGSMSRVSLLSMISYQAVVYDNFNNIVRSSMKLHNVFIKNCYASDTQAPSWIVSVSNPREFILNNLEIKDCTGYVGLFLNGSNIFGENITINNFQPGLGADNDGTAMVVTTNSSYDSKPNVFTNLRISNCVSNQVDWQSSKALMISGVYANYSITENYFINTTIANNTCQSGYGAAVTMGSFAKATFINSIISNNYPRNVLLKSEYGDVRARFLNCLIPPSLTGESFVLNQNPNINTVEWYGNNLHTLPGFNTQNLANTYYLNDDSPCKNAGTTDFSMFTLPADYVFPEIDLAGDKRIYEEIVDLGAYEWSGTANPEADIPLADVSTMSIYPNPFKQTATISFQQKSIGTVNIDVFNVKGQLVKTLLSEHKNSGSNQITWDGRDHNGKMCSSGIYYCRVVSNNKTYTRKLMLVK